LGIVAKPVQQLIQRQHHFGRPAPLVFLKLGSQDIKVDGTQYLVQAELFAIADGDRLEHCHFMNEPFPIPAEQHWQLFRADADVFVCP